MGQQFKENEPKGKTITLNSDECLETICYGFRNVFMNFRIRKANERGTAEHGWLHANFSLLLCQLL